MRTNIVIYHVIGLFTCIIGPIFAVSFYGESYIHIPYEDDFHDTDIELRFKTSRPYGVLLLLTGGADYLLLQIHAGTIQFKVNYGSEDTSFDLGRHRYDDLQWHEVKVTRTDNVISMVIDGTTTFLHKINGKYRELNINKGIFLGGIDSDTNKYFENDLKNFRGTFSKVLLNGMDLVAKGRELTDQKLVVEVSFDNDDIFSASRDSPISLTTETSFISFSHVHPTYERTVSFQFWTDSASALLMFSFTRHSSKRNFFALELINDQLVLTGCKGDERIEVISDSLVGGKWHQLDIMVTSELVELSVNGNVKSKRFQSKNGAIYGGLIYIGGVSQKERTLVIKEGLKSLQGEGLLKGSMIGCIKNIVINSRVYDLHDIHASRLISAECDIKDGCFYVGCDAENKPYADSNSDDFQLLAVNPVIVNEGQNAQISTDNIEIVYDFKQYGIRESGIMIYVVEKPMFGEIRVDLGRGRNSEVFTYLDLMGRKVEYIHHGSENDYDEVAMGLEIYSSSRASEEDFPERLQQRYKFILPITVKHINDPPKIILANNGVLRIIENTKILITNEVMSAYDPDSESKDLMYSVVEEPTQGYFEKSGRNGVPITDFTQKDIDDQQIWFLHLGSGDTFAGMKLSDGLTSSEVARLSIHTVRLRLMVQTKTGLVLPHGSYALITSSNLTTVSNVPTQELEIRYEILNPPRYGVLERQQYANGEWQEVSSFAQRHIDNGLVRYRQTDISQSPSSDQFRFKVKAKTFTTPYDYFRIQFEQVYIKIVANNKLMLLHHRYGVLSSDNLRAVTNNPQLHDDEIIFTIMRPPSLGNFYKIDRRYRGHVDFFDMAPLMKLSSFSQYDINIGSIYYKVKNNWYKNASDFSDLSVHTYGTSDKVFRMWIEIVPMKTDVRFINNGLTDVIEGDQKAIDKHCLFIQTSDFGSFEFTITTPPQYGTLQLINPRSSALISDNINEFTNEDIKTLKLVYKHDDSEHDTDSFSFVAVPDIQRTSPVQEIPEFSGLFEIQMLMRNDNPPERLVDKVFKVVRNGEKLITIDDLAFMDPDVDYDTAELMYERLGIPNGQIVFANNKSYAYNFKQRDIMNGNIMFQHAGADHGEASIYVTDGQYYVDCALVIEAGEPYIKIDKNTGAIVNRRSEIVITAQNISIETNLNINDEHVRFVVMEEPEQGHLEMNGRKVLEFDFHSLKQGKLVYKHEGTAGTEDYFIVAVLADEVRTQGSFSIQIVLETTQLPRVINNKPLEMYSSPQRNIIRREHLLITHPESTAENIEYLILVMPKHGLLYKDKTLLTSDGESTFTQSDINNQIIKYELDDTMATTDQFIFDVSNGYEALRGLEFLINIIPYTLELATGNLSVIEGGKKAIRSEQLKVDDKNSDYETVLYTIHDKPYHGTISNYKGESLMTFTSQDIDSGNVFYIHDDGESKLDQFSVSASVDNGSKESEVMIVYIAIEGINDEAPVVVRNTGLKVWKGSITQITSDNLYTRDPDTPADRLTYRISTPSNGHLSHLNNTLKPIGTFKQSWIDDGQVVFVHKGDANGEFSFEVNDGGDNKSPLNVFRVEARQLTLDLVTNNLLDAYPNTVQPITATHLLTTTNDLNQTKPIIYNVTNMPKHGTLVTIVNGRPLQVSSFDQTAVNRSEIFYKHSGNLYGWLQNDSFEFQVNTLYAERSQVYKFKISISFANLNPENKDQLIKTAPIYVDEGGEMILAKNNLDVTEFVRNLERRSKRVSLTFSLEDRPRHGMLMFRGEDLKKNVRFTQREVNSHEIIYKHDDTDTVSDTFNLTLHLRIEELSMHDRLNNESTFRLVLNVTIQPVNDEKFELLTKNPSLQIVQGFTAPINKSILNTVDNDTMPEYIVYEITREPDNGHVAYKTDIDKKILNFSQRDVNNGLVVFKHKSYKDSGEFFFSVSDGSHSPYYKLFKVQVTKLFVNVTKNSTIELIQSDSVAHLTRDCLDIQTNGLRENVYFMLARQPRYGKLYVNNEVASSFTQKDVDENRIVYKQSDFKNSADYIPISKIVYKFKGFSQKEFFTLFPLNINVKVKPLVLSEPLFAPRGEHVALTVHSLDAVKLSERTGDNPSYEIKNGPYFGRVYFYKKSISKRQIYNENYKGKSGYKPVTYFTHEDIVYTRVFYKSDPYIVPSANRDNFTYILTAFNAQPAEGVFFIDLEPSEDFPIVPDTDTPVKGVVTERTVSPSSEKVLKGDNSPLNEDSVEPSRLKYDHILILAISIPLLIIIVIAFIIVYFVWRGRRKRDYTPASKKSPRLRPHISGPFQIEQPHVHIEPQEKQSEESEDSKSLVEYENTQTIPGVSRPASEEADVIMPMLSHEASHRDQYFSPRSPDMSRTEISCTVPTCKVTPMVDNEVEGAVGGVDTHRQSIGSMGDMIEWITNDPELLQNCTSSSPPVLRKSRYWV